MLAIAPWAEYSAGHPEWFQPDGIHLRFPPGADDAGPLHRGPARSPAAAALHGPPGRRPGRRPRRRAGGEGSPEAKLAPATPPDRILDTRADDGDAFTDARRRRPVAAGPPRRHGRDLRRREPHRRRPVRRRLPHRLPVRRAGAAGVERELRRAAPSTSALATVPLDGDGDFCVYSMSTTDVVVDLYAVSRTNARDGFRAARADAPARHARRLGHGTGARRAGPEHAAHRQRGDGGRAGGGHRGGAERHRRGARAGGVRPVGAVRGGSVGVEPQRAGRSDRGQRRRRRPQRRRHAVRDGQRRHRRGARRHRLVRPRRRRLDVGADADPPRRHPLGPGRHADCRPAARSR